jgi:hypothetical protein
MSGARWMRSMPSGKLHYFLDTKIGEKSLCGKEIKERSSKRGGWARHWSSPAPDKCEDCEAQMETAGSIEQ